MKKLEKLGINPSPWKIGCKNYPSGGILARDGLRIDRLMNVADANLIAAAPEMYKALFDIVAYCESNRLVPSKKFAPILEKSKAALAKAAGESEAANEH